MLIPVINIHIMINSEVTGDFAPPVQQALGLKT